MPKVTIYSDVIGIPHTFLGITDENGVEIKRGFGPEKTGVWGKGKIFDDDGHEHQYSYDINITQKQYDDLISNINKSTKNPNKYNLLMGSQCTVWAMDMLYKSGIIKPFADTFEPNVNIGYYYIPAGVVQTLVLNPYIQTTGIFFNDLLKDTINYWKNYFNPTINIRTFDPLVLDLNNNGRIDTITLNNSKAFFDHNNDNIAYKSSWINKVDGLLVLDKNNNNLIDNGNELFGNFTEIPSSDFKALDTNNNQTLNPTQTTFALNGFEALKLLDSNKDGVIDINDKEFNNLKVWLSEDGITQIKELKSLKDLNITSINLNYKDTNQNLDNDNTITQTATFTKGNKESLNILKPTKLKSA